MPSPRHLHQGPFPRQGSVGGDFAGFITLALEDNFSGSNIHELGVALHRLQNFRVLGLAHLDDDRVTLFTL